MQIENWSEKKKCKYGTILLTEVEQINVSNTVTNNTQTFRSQTNHLKERRGIVRFFKLSLAVLMLFQKHFLSTWMSQSKSKSLEGGDVSYISIDLTKLFLLPIFY